MNTSLQRLSKYELLVRLGHGGMAEVWKALDTQLQRYVAIKLLRADLQNDPSLVTRLEREARLIASLHHPNIVQIHDFLVSHPSEIEGTVVYMVMDYVEGPTLAQYLQNTSRVGRFPSSNDIVHIFTPICLAIDYAHQKGMIHRDIKPANILLDKRDASKDPIGDPVLTDFGIAKLLGTSLNVRTNTGWWLGTPFYISPEQAKGASGNERSDIYALSVILYEMCTGTVPFQGNSLTAIIMQQVHADPIPPHLVNPVITPALEAVILHGLAKEPEKRFSSASALGIAITEALNLPAAESLRQMAHHVDEMNSDTHVNSFKSLAANHSQATAIPTLTSQKTAVPLFSLEQQQFSEHVTSLLEAPPDAASATPPNPASVAPPTPNTTPKTVPASKAPGPIPVSLAKSRSAKPRRRSLVLAALALLAISIAALLLLLDLVVLPPMRSDQIVGNAFFVNSGQLNSDNSQGINDELLLDLHNIPALSSGKAYYAWLLGDQAQSEPSITALGKLTVNQGNIHLFYTGNTRHANLLAYQSRLLITEEDASTTPSAYNPDSTTWRYYAQIPQTPGSNGRFHFSMLDHLRHLLSESPELKTRGLHGGLDMWFLRNTQKILEWASAARDDWGNNPDLLHRQIIRILDYLDGKDYVQLDAPAIGPILYADPQASQLALLGPPPDGQSPYGNAFSGKTPPGYTYLIPGHLTAAMLSPGATPSQRALAAQIHSALDQTRGWLEQMHQDALQLITMDIDQLAYPSTLAILNDMVTHAQLAYNGQYNTSTGEIEGGATWISGTIQRIAGFELKPFQQ